MEAEGVLWAVCVPEVGEGYLLCVPAGYEGYKDYGAGDAAFYGGGLGGMAVSLRDALIQGLGWKVKHSTMTGQIDNIRGADGHPDCDTAWMPPECREAWRRWVFECGPDMRYPMVDGDECDRLAVALCSGWEAGKG